MPAIAFERGFLRPTGVAALVRAVWVLWALALAAPFFGAPESIRVSSEARRVTSSLWTSTTARLDAPSLDLASAPTPLPGRGVGHDADIDDLATTGPDARARLFGPSSARLSWRGPSRKAPRRWPAITLDPRGPPIARSSAHAPRA